MARGKAKFKGKQGKSRKFVQKNKKSRKKYSLFDNKLSKNKRDREDFSNEEPEEKRSRSLVEKAVEVFSAQNNEEDDFEEEENNVQALLNTFNPNQLQFNKAIDSSSSDDEEIADDDTKEEYADLDNYEEVNDVQEQDEENDEEQKDVKDPFNEHFLYDLSENLLRSIQLTPIPTEIENREWSELESIQILIPTCEKSLEENNSILKEERQFATVGTVPKKIKLKGQSSEELFIKNQIKNNLQSANKCLNVDDQEIFFTPLEAEIFSILNNYQDLYFPKRNLENGEQIRFVYCLHAVNHILKTRTKILHHNTKLASRDDVPEEFRDQGLTRPKVLILAPFRDSAYRMVNVIANLLFKEDKGNVINKIRFVQEFTGHELSLPKKNPKPEDYEKLFAGNTGDEFKIGMSITKKSLKLFTDFYSSDIIIASPLGLRTIIGAEGEKERDYDFLASIEILILDQIELFLMQNWDHMLHVFNHLHLQPKESHGTDFSRVRTWTLNGWSKYYRQTLIFSSTVLPEINSIFNKCTNYKGKVKIVNFIKNGSICQVHVQLPHVFQKFQAKDILEAVEERFQFFITKIVPQHNETLMKQTLIYVTNYFDYVRLRNHFKREDISFVQICEYSKDGKIARARDMFFHGDAQFLLYTERYHFFNRIRVKGIRHLIFYSPPTVPHFYYEICNLMQETNMNKKIGNMSNMTVTILYSKYDVNQLATVVGTERALRMVESDRNVHMLVTNSKG